MSAKSQEKVSGNFKLIKIDYKLIHTYISTNIIYMYVSHIYICKLNFKTNN